MFEDLLYAFSMFRRNKTRTLLSLLGVIIGVASVITITTVGQSASRNVGKIFESTNMNLIRVSGGFNRRGRSSAGTTFTFNEAFRKDIFDTIPHIRKVWYNNDFSATLTVGELSTTVSLTAVEYGYPEMTGLPIHAGSSFGATDDVEGSQTILLGSETAAALFPEVPPETVVGQRILAVHDGVSYAFRVVGVMKEEESVGMDSSGRSNFVPRGFYAKKVAPNPAAGVVILEATESRYAASISEEVKEYAEKKAGDSYALDVFSMQTMLDQFNQVTATMNALLGGIAAISLLVGGIGIMNIMIVTVTERKKEIAIRKAIGATPADIRRQFLVESAAIALIGGVVGIAAGLAISAAAVAAKKWPFALNPFSITVTFAFSALVGIFFGLNPAERAAKLDPVAALSAE